MAEYKILRGSRKAEEQPVFEEQITENIVEPSVQPPQTEGPGLLSRLGVSLVKGLELPGEIVNQLAQAIGEPSFLKQRLSQDITQALGATEEQLAPQGVVEKYGQRVLQQAPTAALFGPAALARTAVSAAPAVAAGEAGAPEWAQDLIQFGSDIALGIRSGQIKNPSIAKAQKQAYEAARSLVSDAESPGAPKVIEALTQVGKDLQTETDAKTVKRVSSMLKTVKDNFRNLFAQRGEAGLNPKTAMDLRRKIYKLQSKYPDLTEYTKPITEGINGFFAEYGSSNPEFIEKLSKADKLTAAKNMNSFLEGAFKQVPFLGKVPGLTELFGKTIGQGEKIAKQFAVSPEARSIYLDTIKSVAEGNVPLIAKNLQDLDVVVNEPEINLAQESTRKPFKIIRGRRT